MSFQGQMYQKWDWGCTALNTYILHTAGAIQGENEREREGKGARGSEREREREREMREGEDS